jgi:hypothetical protein
MTIEIDINEYNALKYIVSELAYLVRCQGGTFDHIENSDLILNVCYQQRKKSPYDKED